MIKAKISEHESSFSRLNRMGIVAWEQVLLVLPYEYKDYTKAITSLPSSPPASPDGKACYQVTVTSRPKVAAHSSTPRISLEVSDGIRNATLTVFGDIWSWKNLSEGEEITVECQMASWQGALQMKNPVLVQNVKKGKLLPIYRGKRGANKDTTVTPKFMYEKTREALASHLDETAYFIMLHFPVMEEKQLLRRAGVKFESLQEMLKSIHNPKTKQEGMEGLAAARAIAAFEVVFYAERQMVRKPNPVASIRVDLQHIEELKSKFPFNLTKHQDDGITDIVTDLRRPYRMNRLLSGDVGYGKTEVALIPAIAARAAGAKVAIMCPSLLIVNQWAEKIKGYGSKIPVCVIAGNGKASKAENITKAKLDSNPIMVGTTALITRLPKLDWTPDFVILDEQQKHGKNHKDTITGPNTNRLEATATCQPKTSAMVNYGGMDESILNQCPVDKQITTRIVLKEDKERMFSHIKRIMTDIKDSQIAVVYPSVSQEDEKTSLIAASATWEKLFPGQIGVLHGGMTDDEKVEVIRKMHNLEIRILCASVLIETGLTLPSLRGMVVVSADRFGVSALHQLRGRLARHGGQGYFHMYVPDEDISPDTISRLKLLENHTDGFVLAEKDAEMRGYGSISEDDDDQSGVSKSTLFYNLKLMPKDIETVARNRKLLI